MSEDVSQVVMYVLMRNDLASMTPGRAVAQGTHAANECVKFIRDDAEESGDYRFSDLLDTWENETGSFGTTIVLSASIDQVNEIYDKVEEYADFVCGITHDPEYAVRDGITVHLIPLDTCMWIFGRKDDIRPYVDHLYLY